MPPAIRSATGKLIEGANGGMANVGRGQAAGGPDARHLLTDFDVGSVPLLRTDAYGNFIPAANGMPQLITGVGGDGIPNTSDDSVRVGNIAALYQHSIGASARQSAFLADIAHDGRSHGKLQTATLRSAREH